MERRLAIGLTAAIVIVGIWWFNSSSNAFRLPSVDSGDGWTLLDSNVDPAHIPGSVEPLESRSGFPGLRFIVATSSGGDTDCYPPRLVGSTRTESTLTLDFQWQQRGCADMGGEAFDLAVHGVPEGGLAVIFPITAERDCKGAVLYRDGSVAGCRP